MTSFVSALLTRDLAKAFSLAEPLAAKANQPVAHFLANQCSERAYLVFRSTASERAVALDKAGRLIFARKASTSSLMDSLKLTQQSSEESTIIATNWKYVDDCVSLLRARSQITKEDRGSVRDTQILSRSLGYRVLLSKTATQLFPILAAFGDSGKTAKLSYSIQRDLVGLGPEGPLEVGDNGMASEMNEWALVRENAANSFWKEMSKFSVDTALKHKCPELIQYAHDIFSEEIERESSRADLLKVFVDAKRLV